MRASNTDAHDPLVTVVVVNRDRRELLRACLRSIVKQVHQNVEVIVVDNGSTDRSETVTAENEFSRLPIRLINNLNNRGFCAANNQALQFARGKYVALLNNDAEADKSWLQALVAALEENPEFGMAASKILLHGDRGVIDKAGHLIYPDGQNRGRGTGEQDIGQYDRMEETAWPDGCAAFYRRALFEHVGGFDEDFFAYADDAELGLRARIAGWRCLYVPAALAYHHGAATLGSHSLRRLFLIERNRSWLAAKLFPWRLLLLNPLYFSLRALATGLALVLGRGEGSQAVSSISFWGLLKCALTANLAAIAGLPAMLRKRRTIEPLRKLSPAEVGKTIRRFQIPLADLVLKAR
jgi:GT2 family glycosyltransferase